MADSAYSNVITFASNFGMTPSRIAAPIPSVSSSDSMMVFVLWYYGEPIDLGHSSHWQVMAWEDNVSSDLLIMMQDWIAQLLDNGLYYPGL